MFATLCVILQMLVVVTQVSSCEIIVILVFGTFRSKARYIPGMYCFYSFSTLNVLRPFGGPYFGALEGIRFQSSTSFGGTSGSGACGPGKVQVFLSSSGVAMYSL